MNMKSLCLVWAVAALGCCCRAAEVRFDFESGDLQGWQVVEGAFGKIVSDRDKEHHTGNPYPKEGKWFLSTLETADDKPNDGFVGVVESPVVVLSAPEVRLRVGGGKGSGVYVALCSLDGREVAFARGENAQQMHTRTLDAKELVGKPVFFRVVDRETGSWGHITLDHVICQGTVDTKLTAERDARRKLTLFEKTLLPTRAAIEEIGARFPDYPAKQLLAELAKIDDTAAVAAFQRKALVTLNPIVNASPILFVTRKQYRGDHHNTATMFQTGEINTGSYDTEGALKLLDVKAGAVTTLLDPGKGVTVRDPDIDFDASRVVFSMRKGKADDYHIYTLALGGGEPVQLTRAKGVSDIDPVWLPDGDILFSSTREPKYCMCNRHIMCNLYRMKPDGANIHQIGKSTLFEGHASVMPDGRILYDRWEYVDRNFGDAQGLWVCNPDGTGHALYWGNNTTSPGAILDARTLSQAHLCVATLAACHDRPWGALGIIDRSKGIDGPGPVLRTWPADFRDRIKTGGQDFDSTTGLRVKYEDPFPLDDEHFLCARQNGNGEETAIYYLDLHGNEVLVHAEAPGCYDPMPLRPRATPPVQPTRRTFDGVNAPGTFYIQNVYIGTHMKGVEPGDIKFIRVIESPEKRVWSQGGWGGQGEQAAAMNWLNFENKRILGTVPVEDDGSAYFEAPANTFVFFQALDKNGMLVQSMRSGAYVQPGETYGCVGCHENRTGDIPPASKPKALSRPPHKLTGWHGAPRLFSFQAEVQPVFDKHCVTCHDYGKRGGAKLNLSGDRDVYFSTSYVDIWALGHIKCVGAGPAEIQEAYSWGSHPSKLTAKALSGHGRVALSDEERDRIITWVDINAPYYPRYECAYPANPGGRSPLTGAELNQLKELTGIRIEGSHGARQRAQVSFDRPEKSRILDKLDPESDPYQKALAIIREGAKRLEEKPRADSPSFTPCDTDLARERRYEERLAREHKIYDAIRNNQRVYDPEE